jgi:glycosyltransferase involved in cell wall biosynthesis
VTTRHGGIPEYVRDGETAIVVAENDVDALAGALVRLLQDSDLASRLAAGGPAAVSGLDLHQTAARMDALYDGLIG